MTIKVRLGSGLSCCPEQWQRFVCNIIDDVSNNDVDIAVRTRLHAQYCAELVDEHVVFNDESLYTLFMLEWA